MFKIKVTKHFKASYFLCCRKHNLWSSDLWALKFSYQAQAGDWPVTPQLLHHVFHLLAVLVWWQLSVALGSKLGCVHLSKLLQGERPAMESRAKANCSSGWIDLWELTQANESSMRQENFQFTFDLAILISKELRLFHNRQNYPFKSFKKIKPFDLDTSSLALKRIRLTETHHDVAHRSMLIFSISGDDDVDGLYNTLESLVKVFRLKLQLQQGTVHFVHHQDWLDALSNGLTEHGLSLYTNTWQG